LGLNSPASSPGAFGEWCNLLKLPRLAKKLRVISGWTLELLFSREIEQVITLRDVEELTSRMARIRARAASDGSSGSKRLNEVMLN
jgi:hypothetical protein